MHRSTRYTAARLTTLGVAMLTVWGCNRGAPAAGDTGSAGGAVATAADTLPMVRGTVASVSSANLVVKADTGSVTLKVAPPLDVYQRVPATLADVKPNTFIGVTTVRQPDGSERATEIHIFPEALRGLGEGSRMMNRSASGAGAGSRMTNGAVSGSRMTNGAAMPSRMSNGNVSAANDSSLVVQYAGGSLKVIVPPNVRVTELKAVSTPLMSGEQVVVVAKKNPDGSLTATKAMISGR